jgi:hypothetical protein
MEKTLGRPEWERNEEPDAGVEIDVESRVDALRRLRVHIARQYGQTPVEDPFPDLAGEE